MDRGWSAVLVTRSVSVLTGVTLRTPKERRASRGCRAAGGFEEGSRSFLVNRTGCEVGLRSMGARPCQQRMLGRVVEECWKGSSGRPPVLASCAWSVVEAPSRCMMGPSGCFDGAQVHGNGDLFPHSVSVVGSKFARACCRTGQKVDAVPELNACLGIRRFPISSRCWSTEIRAMAGLASADVVQGNLTMPSVADSKMERCFFSHSRNAFSVALREMAMARCRLRCLHGPSWRKAEVSSMIGDHRPQERPRRQGRGEPGRCGLSGSQSPPGNLQPRRGGFSVEARAERI
jgi:hypothetical protein